MAQFSLEHFTIKKLEKIQILFKDNVTQGSSLTLKPANFYNIEKHINLTHINFESKLCMLCAYYRLWANPIPKNIGSFHTHNESLYNKL